MERLRYIGHRAQQEYPLIHRHWAHLEVQGERCTLSDDSGEPVVEESIDTILGTLYQRMHRTALSALPDHIRIHAASGMAQDGLFLLVGPKRAGKTTLILHLLSLGVEILGDELVLLNNRSAVTFPRRFFVREGSLRLLPDVASLQATAPFVRNPEEGRLIAVDPLHLGRDWLIRPARLAHVIYIEPTHDQPDTEILPCGKLDMVRRVMAEATPPESGRRDWIADFSASIDQARTSIVRLGALEHCTDRLLRLFGTTLPSNFMSQR